MSRKLTLGECSFNKKIDNYNTITYTVSNKTKTKKIICYVVGVKKTNEKIEGFFVTPSNFSNPITIYQEAYVVFSHNQIPVYEYVIRHSGGQFPLQLEKSGENYQIVIPDNDAQKKAIEELYKTDIHSSDFI